MSDLSLITDSSTFNKLSVVVDVFYRKGVKYFKSPSEPAKLHLAFISGQCFCVFVSVHKFAILISFEIKF